MAEISAPSNEIVTVKLDDPLSVYEFTDDFSSQQRVDNIIASDSVDSKLNSNSAVTVVENVHHVPVHYVTTESLNVTLNSPVVKEGEVSTGRMTRSQTAHSRVNGGESTTVNNLLNFPRARGRPLKRKHVKRGNGRYKGKSVEVIVGVSTRKRKVEAGLEDQEGPSSRNLKAGDFYIPPSKHFHIRVSSHTNCEVIKLLKSKLSDRQLQMFGETQFGYFLDLPDVVVQNQLIHSLLLREVVSERDDEMWFNVNGTKLRFGLEELGIITGLKCCGDADKGYESSVTNRLMDTYFPGLEKVPKYSLIDCFLQKRWRSDEDAVRIAVLYFIHTFLLASGVKVKFIRKADFDIVESGDYETFPWGITVFKAIVATMSNKLRPGLKMYRLGGLPLALQCWFYECCPTADGKWAHRVDNKVPRILNWKVMRQPTMNELSGWFRDMSGYKVNLKNVFPTEFEKVRWDLPESSGNQNDKEVASEDLPEVHSSDDDFITPLPKKSRNQPEAKLDPPMNNLEMNVELKRLSDGQLELKHDIRMLNEDVFKAIGSLKEQMLASFADVFKAIESLSKKRSEKNDSEVLPIELVDTREGHHDRQHDNYGCFNANDDHGIDGPDHGKDSITDKENSENEAMGSGLTNAEGKSIFPVPHLTRCKSTGLPAEWQIANKARCTPHK